MSAPPSTPTPSLGGLVAKLARASQAVARVPKDGTNRGQGYRFTSAAAVLTRVNAALVAEGLAVVAVVPEIVSVEGSGRERLVTVRVSITVADDTGASVTFVGLGSGMDVGDKAVMKAQTAATKYAWLGGLSISMGDDPEADDETDRRTGSSTSGPRRTAPSTGSRPSAPPRPVSPANTAPAAVPLAPAPAPTVLRVVPPAGADLGHELVRPDALERFAARVDEVELPGEAVAVWLKFRDGLASLGVEQREEAWRLLIARTERVGRMVNAKVWLKKAIAEEEGRRAVAGGSR